MSTPSVPPPCPHLAAHRLSSRPLRFLRRCLRVCPLGRPEIRRGPRELLSCSPCAIASPSPTSRLYVCLSCAAVFCPSHTATHASASAGPGHEIAVDVDRAELFCAACGDRVYDPDFDHAVFLAQSSTPPRFSPPPPPPPPPLPSTSAGASITRTDGRKENTPRGHRDRSSAAKPRLRSLSSLSRPLVTPTTSIDQHWCR
ncbi:hypothetical protein ZEAMMB73_Zm00001d028127 [Zea mays]|uniref:UBP-type domain-containing protein n=1 Tax=Zea mays TaxID=4577 RepID=A0A1D6JS92_MAIZE|nr:hypothetical protein ZEAMMB73_Zm00001d028127 [Zea mays]